MNLENIALIGFMGVGKTTCGQYLARKLGYTFFDTDQAIVDSSGRSIANIFKTQGEAAFRALERDLVYKTIPQLNHTIISTGGGLGANPEYIGVLKQHAMVVHLCLPAEDIYDRVKGNRSRPLLQTEDPLARIRELLAQRLPAYHTAHVELSVRKRPLPQIIFQILLNYRLYTRRRRNK
ncbi:MAG: shikimate kinase [Verrucomicrobia bacterium]|nr:shikimate kinase [Verrucomicrobiota bacterium]